MPLFRATSSKRLLLAVIFVGQLAVFELNGLAFGQKGDLHRVFAGSVDGQRLRCLAFFLLPYSSIQRFRFSSVISKIVSPQSLTL